MLSRSVSLPGTESMTQSPRSVFHTIPGSGSLKVWSALTQRSAVALSSRTTLRSSQVRNDGRYWSTAEVAIPDPGSGRVGSVLAARAASSGR